MIISDYSTYTPHYHTVCRGRWNSWALDFKLHKWESAKWLHSATVGVVAFYLTRQPEIKEFCEQLIVTILRVFKTPREIKFNPTENIQEEINCN